jgi:hypothetical protein
MAEDPVKFGETPSLRKCLLFARAEGSPIGLIVIDGVAMELYGLPRGTLDIDAEIRCEPSFYERLVRHLSDREIQFNIGEDIDHWGVIPLPTGYRRRAKTIYREKGVVIKVLDPLDFIASKLRRGIDQDLQDAADIAHRFSLSREKISSDLEKIKFPHERGNLSLPEASGEFLVASGEFVFRG